MNCVRLYRWRRLRALYLNSALVWRRARTLWTYNELVLTNHGTHISLNILKQVIKQMGEGGRAYLVLVKCLVSLRSRCYRRHSSLEVSFNSWNELNWFQQLVLNSLRVTSEFCLPHLGWNLHWWGRGARYRFLHLHQKLQRFFRLWWFLR